MDDESYHDDIIDSVLEQYEKEKTLELWARLICDAMSGNTSLFDNLSQPMLIQLEQSDFYSAAQAVIDALDAEVAKR